MHIHYLPGDIFILICEFISLQAVVSLLFQSFQIFLQMHFGYRMLLLLLEVMDRVLRLINSTARRVSSLMMIRQLLLLTTIITVLFNGRQELRMDKLLLVETDKEVD